ncbi:hypothetical protein NKG94_02505 [Micromonospora sp. M12]
MLIGGVDATEWPPDALAARLVLVADHDRVFTMSLADNVRLGQIGADTERVLDAVKRAGVDEFASAMRDGVDTRLGAGVRRCPVGSGNGSPSPAPCCPTPGAAAGRPVQRARRQHRAPAGR